MMSVQIKLLGRIAVADNGGGRDDGEIGPLGGPKPKAALVELALRPGQVVTVDHLIDALWGDDPPPTARRSLHAHVAKLKKALGGSGGPLSSAGNGYLLEVDRTAVDVLRVEDDLSTARRAVEANPDEARAAVSRCRAAWRGDPLADLVDHGPSDPIRERLRRLGTEIDEVEAEVLLATATPSDAIASLERSVGSDPYHEPHWARLMRAYYRAGRQSDALDTYQRARSVMVEELGVEPSLELRDLERSILQQDVDESTGPASPPYKGLASYQIDDSGLFHGRDSVVAEVLDAIRNAPIVAVVGASGSGKSSLLRAGVAHRVSGGAIPGLRRVAVATPGQQPLRSLYRADDADLLIVDQFEELFTLTDDPGVRQQFVDGLLTMAGAGHKVALAVRADFYGHGVTMADLAPVFARHQVIVPPMDEADVRDAVVLPARACGLEVEPGLVDELVGEVAGEPGALPLLSHALVETWRRRTNGVLTLAGYEGAGSLGGAIASTAESVYELLDDTERNRLQALMSRLVESGDDVAATRRVLHWSELEGLVGYVDLIDRLVAARLLVTTADTIEIAHEALIAQWPRLESWIDERRDSIRLHRHLATAAASWTEAGDDESELYRGTRLDAALRWRAETTPELSTTEQRFLDASETASRAAEERQRRANRRLRMLAGVSVVAMVVAVAAGTIAWGRSQEADRRRVEAETAQEASAARARDDLTQIERLALAVSLQDRADTPETAGLLLDSLAATPALTRTSEVPVASIVATAPLASTGGVLSVADRSSQPAVLDVATGAVTSRPFTPRFDAVVRVDDRLLGMQSETGQVVELATSRPRGPAPAVDGDMGAVALSPDGSAAAVVVLGPGARSTVERFDVATGSVLFATEASDDPIAAMQFSPGGDLLAAVVGEVRVAIWDAVTGSNLLTTPASGATAPVSAVAIAADGTTVAVGRGDGSIDLWLGEDQQWRRVGLQSSHDGEVSWLEFGREDRVLVSSAGDGTVVVWLVDEARPLAGPVRFDTNKRLVSMVDPASDGITTIAADGTIWTWDDAPMAGLASTSSDDGATVDLEAPTASGGDRRARLSGRRIVVTDSTGTVVEEIGFSPPGGGVIERLSLSDDGRFLVVAVSDGAAVWYDLDGTDAEVLAVVGDGFDARFVAGSTVAGVGTDGLWLVDLDQSTARSALGIGRGARRFALSEDRSWAATGEAGAVQLWDVASRKPIGAAVWADAPVEWLSVSDDGGLLIGHGATAAVLPIGGDAWLTRGCALLPSEGQEASPC